jgi:hypothetical protein
MASILYWITDIPGGGPRIRRDARRQSRIVGVAAAGSGQDDSQQGQRWVLRHLDEMRDIRMLPDTFEGARPGYARERRPAYDPLAIVIGRLSHPSRLPVQWSEATSLCSSQHRYGCIGYPH